MKQGDVIVGETYEARVSGRLVRVLVLGETVKVDRERVARRRWRVRNLATQREITVTAARLRALPKPRAAVERGTCSHCGKLASTFMHEGRRIFATHGTRTGPEPGAEIIRCAGSREAVL